MDQIKLLGTLEITEDGESAAIMKSPQGCALLTYLLVTRQGHSREVMADLLWDAFSTADSLRYLRKLLYRVRSLVPALEVTRQRVSYNLDKTITVDIYTLQEALAGDDVGQLDVALKLYRGELLAEFYLEDATGFNEWLLLEREQLRQQVWGGYRRVCAAYTEAQTWPQGVEVARRWLALDVLDEEVHRQLIHFLAADGQLAAARKQLDACRIVLWDELGVEPEPITLELAARLEELQAEIGDGLHWSATVDAQLTWPEPGELPEPGLLPTQAWLPYHRNTAFTGRGPELLAIADQLRPNHTRPNGPTPDAPSPEIPSSDAPISGAPARAVVINGMGGLGKTQLAVEYAYRYGRFYPGGVYWISFADAGNIADEVAALGGERTMRLFQESEKLTQAEQVARVQSEWQKPIPRLLIFDNCEEEQLALDWLPFSGGSSVLLTSRRGEWPRELPIRPLPLNSLPREESIALLRQTADHVTAAEADLVAAEVGDLPLALHLAGQFLARLKRISPQDYVTQLQNEAGLQHVSLQGKASKYSPTGHELNVARTFALSFQQLNPDNETDKLAKQLMASVICFAAGEPINQSLLLATAVDDESDVMALFEAEDALLRLVDLGLLARSNGRGDNNTVVMHRLLVAFTQETTAKDKAAIATAQTAVESAIVSYLTPKIERPEFMGRLPIATTQLQHITEAALLRESQLGPSLAFALGRHLNEEGEAVTGNAYLEKGYAAAESHGDLSTQGRILTMLAMGSEKLGRANESVEYAERAEEYLPMSTESNQIWLVDALLWQSRGYGILGELDKAHAASQQAHQLSVESQDKLMIASSLDRLGTAELDLFNWDLSAQYTQEALLLYQELGEHYASATAQANLGNNAIAIGNCVQALSWYQQALATIRQVGNRPREIAFLVDVCVAQISLGDHATAVASLQEVREKIPENWRLVPYYHYVLAEALSGIGNQEAALQEAQTAFAASQAIDDPFEIGEVWRVLGHMAAQLDRAVSPQPEEDESYTAAACFTNALECFDKIGMEDQRAHVLCRWASYEKQHGDQQKSATMEAEAREIFQRLKLPLFVAEMEAS